MSRWQPALEDAAKRTQGPSARYLLGFSNGAYFATLIATRDLAPFDAIAIAHGGPVEPTKAMGKKPPLLLISADEDPSDPEMGTLDQLLTHEQWPHALVAREGGHALLDCDVEMALTFFERTQKEQLPLAPALGRGRRPAPALQQENLAPEAGAQEPTGETTTTSADLPLTPPAETPAE